MYLLLSTELYVGLLVGECVIKLDTIKLDTRKNLTMILYCSSSFVCGCMSRTADGDRILNFVQVCEVNEEVPSSAAAEVEVEDESCCLSGDKPFWDVILKKSHVSNPYYLVQTLSLLSYVASCCHRIDPFSIYEVRTISIESYCHSPRLAATCSD